MISARLKEAKMNLQSTLETVIEVASIRHWCQSYIYLIGWLSALIPASSPANTLLHIPLFYHFLPCINSFHSLAFSSLESALTLCLLLPPLCACFYMQPAFWSEFNVPQIIYSCCCYSWVTSSVQRAVKMGLSRLSTRLMALVRCLL